MDTQIPTRCLNKLQALGQDDIDQNQNNLIKDSNQNDSNFHHNQNPEYQKTKQQEQKIVNTKLNNNFVSQLNEDDEKSRCSFQQDRENTLDKSQIIAFQGADGDSIIEGDFSKNYLQYSKNMIGQSNIEDQKQYIFKNIDEMQINEVNDTQNKINNDQLKDQVKEDETQKYIENTFKSLIASQKQHIQQQLQEQQQQQQQLSHDCYEPPQCRICLEVEEDDENVNNKSQQGIFQNMSNVQMEYTEGKTINKKLKKGPLMSPCKCSGSSKYIHEKCIKEWIQQTYADISQAQCEICKQSYVQRFQFEKKFNCSHIYFCSHSKEKIIAFFIWLILFHFFIITTILILVDIFAFDQENNIFIKTKSKIAKYIVLLIDICIDIACLIIFKKYLINLFKTKKLIDWQIMNFTKHPKEKHPKLIEKYCEGKQSRDANSVQNKNLQLQLMMNNTIDNKANSLHNATHGQSNGLNQSQICRPANSIFNSQKIQRNNSNYLQTVNFFANMGVSENILNDYINNQELRFDDQQIPIKGQGNIIFKKCTSQEDGSQEKSINNQDQQGSLKLNSSLKIKIPSPVNNSHPLFQNITPSEKLTTRKESNNFLSLPFDERSPDKLNGFSSYFGKAEDKSPKKYPHQKWQRHIFFAKDQPYEIIVKPSESLENMQGEVNQNIINIKELENSNFIHRNPDNQSLKRFFDSTLESSNQEKSRIENIQQKQAESFTKLNGEEVSNKAQQNQDKKQLFRVCESIESSSDEKIDVKKINNESSSKQQQTEQQENKQVAIAIQIRKQIPKPAKQATSQKRLQNILYEKIQKQNPQIGQEILQNQSQLNQNCNISHQNSKENPGQLFSSLNTQAQTQGVGDSQKTQINNKSFLSSNHVSVQNFISRTKSNESLKENNNSSYKNESNEQNTQKQINLNLKHINQYQTLETQESGIQKNDKYQQKDKQNELQVNIQQNKEDNMQIESLDV